MDLKSSSIFKILFLIISCILVILEDQTNQAAQTANFTDEPLKELLGLRNFILSLGGSDNAVYPLRRQSRCGHSMRHVSPRIVGGIRATAEEFP